VIFDGRHVAARLFASAICCRVILAARRSRLCRVFNSARSRQVEPHMGADRVPPHALAGQVDETEIVLSCGDTLIGCLSEPTQRSRIVRWDE
jgi:hypothetical protein